MLVESLYRERIPGDGPTLVFLHHGLGCTRLWRDFPRTLCARTGLPGLIYDRCGHGQSPACRAPRTARYLHQEAGVLRELLQAEGIADFHLIGHSDGGSIALLYAGLPGATAPRSIVTLAAHVFVEPVTRTGIRAAVDNWPSLRPRLEKYHGAQTAHLFWEWAGCWLSPGFDSWNIRGDIRQVQCPVAILQGDHDEYGTEEQMRAIAESIGGSSRRILIPSAAHDPHLQAPEATLQAVYDWLK